MSIEILYDVPVVHDATSFYRAARPLHGLRKLMPELTYKTLDKWDWGTMSFSDNIFFMQRPFTKNHVVKAEIARDTGFKLWLDYDDYLLDVPTDNPTYKVYGKDEVRKNVEKLISLAHVITVSTKYLKELYEKNHPGKYVVINNAYEHTLFNHYRKPKPDPRCKLMAWRGSATHHKDVMGYAAPIISTSRDPMFKDWIWRMMGDNLWFLTDLMPPDLVHWSEGIDIIEYFRHIYEIFPAAFMVPLNNSNFNRSKSNITWIEATHAGAVTIAPKWEEWDNPGVLTYKNQTEYGDLLKAVMKGEVDIEKNVQQSWEYIHDKYLLSQASAKRKEVLLELLDSRS
jgi:hypothetical protein